MSEVLSAIRAVCEDGVARQVIAAEGLIWWFLFYGLWQSACAASLATALPRR